jgi:hypothetical protein
MIEIGSEAITHALHWIPQNSGTFKMIQNYLGVIRDHDIPQITELVQQHRKIKPLSGDRYRETFYCENRLLEATKELLKLSITERYVSGDMLEFVLVPSWNNSDRTESEQLAEKHFQDSVLRPKIESSFEQLRIAEKKLKKAA